MSTDFEAALREEVEELKKAELKFSIERVDGGDFKDDVACSGTEVEVLGMISKARLILVAIESKVIDNVREGIGNEGIKRTECGR